MQIQVFQNDYIYLIMSAVEDGAEENGMAEEKEKNTEEATEDSNVEAAETSPPTQFLEEKYFPRSSSTISLSRDFGTPVLVSIFVHLCVELFWLSCGILQIIF